MAEKQSTSTLDDPASKLYAKALFEHALESKNLAEVVEGFNAFCSDVLSLTELDTVLISPLFSTEEKAKIVDEVGAKLHTKKEVIQFIKVLAANGRYGQLQIIKRSLQALVDKQQNVVRGVVTSAAVLSDSEKRDLAAAFEKKLGKKVIFEQTIDKSIIGGLIVKVQGLTFDGSLSTALHRLRESLERQSI